MRTVQLSNQDTLSSALNQACVSSQGLLELVFFSNQLETIECAPVKNYALGFGEFVTFLAEFGGIWVRDFGRFGRFRLTNGGLRGFQALSNDRNPIFLVWGIFVISKNGHIFTCVHQPFKACDCAALVICRFRQITPWGLHRKLSLASMPPSTA